MSVRILNGYSEMAENRKSEIA